MSERFVVCKLAHHGTAHQLLSASSILRALLELLCLLEAAAGGGAGLSLAHRKAPWSVLAPVTTCPACTPPKPCTSGSS